MSWVQRLHRQLKGLNAALCVACLQLSSSVISVSQHTATFTHLLQDKKALAHVLGPLLAVIGVLLIALVAVAAAWRWGLTGIVQRFSDQAEKKVPPGGTAKDVTLVLTDVQVSITVNFSWNMQLLAVP